MVLSDQQLRDILENLDSGLRCHLHRQTGKIVCFPNDTFMMDDDIWEDNVKEVDNHPADYITILPMPSSKEFSFLEEFIREVDDLGFQKKLRNAINQRRPFRNFKYEIDHDGRYRKAWFDFREKGMTAWIYEQLNQQTD